MQWRDVDLKKGFIHVRQALGDADDEAESGFKRAVQNLRPGSATTQRSIRRSRRSPQSTPRVAERKAQPARPSVPERRWLVHTHVKMVPPRMGSARHGRKAPAVTFHSLRHVGNTLSAQQGVSLSLLQSRLGHATPGVTLGVYSHVGATEGQRGAKIIGTLLGGANRRGKWLQADLGQQVPDNEKAR